MELLSQAQCQRYARQIALPEIGVAGQKRLLASKVLLIGVGGLGSPAGYYLAAAGIGTLGIIDGDTLELSNLQRQIAHTTADLGRPKAESAARTFTALNPDIRVNAHNLRLAAENAPGLFKEYDFIIDATDNFESKFLIAGACHAVGKPYSHAGILKFIGQTLTVIPGKTACLRCVFDELPPVNKAPPQGPLGAVPGVIGIIQATEAIKYLLGIGDLLTDRLLTYDALRLQFRCVRINRTPACPLCRGA
ncbi:MAG: HesA/MoeB/ThiF family protein [Kiritimatiellae bacterium]|nr:HesA/MoeB/ThiF family protein [Kiritimatiellia bacterium]